MRTYKFRAWDKELKKMCNLINLDWFVNSASGESPSWIKVERDINDEDGKYCRTDEKEGTQEVFELMQFTGLKDKQGKEIYEGDIVHDEVFDEICEIGFGQCSCGMGDEYGAWGFYLKRKKYNSLLDDSAYIEIIGNIFENLALVKKSTP